jgi:predicted nucleic-acid-binding Zn-ribbon protein
MRSSHTCPKCHGRKFLVAPDVVQPDTESINGTHSLVVTCKYMPTSEGSFFSSGNERVIAGKFEAWICAGCGYTEWYAKLDAPAVELLLKAKTLRLVDAGNPAPFR